MESPTPQKAPQGKMDAYAYLIRHGWSGTGNPLNPDRISNRGGLGLTKPILVGRRQGNSGIGKTTTKDPTNQWWLRGFEDALKSVGSENAGSGAVNGGMTTTRSGNALTSELYRFFVRGEVVPGTVGNKGGEVLGKRKRGGEESKEERRQRKEEKRRRKAEKEDKRKRRAEKVEAKQNKRDKKVRRKEQKEEKKREKRERKAKKTEGNKPEDDYPTPVSMDLDSTDYGQDGSSLDVEKLNKSRKEQEENKDKESKKSKKQEPSSDDNSKRKLKKSKTA
ncbi:hypothetical protein BJX99DRAFT_262711 [Aspergillus californicus]